MEIRVAQLLVCLRPTPKDTCISKGKVARFPDLLYNKKYCLRSGAVAWTGEGRGTDHAPVSERGYAMLLAQLALVAGGVGTEAYDSVFNDQVCVCVCLRYACSPGSRSAVL